MNLLRRRWLIYSSPFVFFRDVFKIRQEKNSIEILSSCQIRVKKEASKIPGYVGFISVFGIVCCLLFVVLL